MPLTTTWEITPPPPHRRKPPTSDIYNHMQEVVVSPEHIMQAKQLTKANIYTSRKIKSKKDLNGYQPVLTESKPCFE